MGWSQEDDPNDVPVVDQDLDLDHAFGALDDLTNEDKFFLIQ